MNPVNLCAHLQISHIDHPTPFKYMFELQQNLQARLNAGLKSTDTLQDVIDKVIYWNYCMQGEIVELLEWREPFSPGEEKEQWMEVVDILHFAMNIGIMLDIDPDELEKDLRNFIWTSRADDAIDVYRAMFDLLTKTTEVINQLPWKTWKTYPSTANGIDKARDSFFTIVASVFRVGCTVGMSKQDIINYYCSKNLENHARQDRGY